MAQRERILAGCGGKLVDERLHDERVEREIDGAPPAARHRRGHVGVVQAIIRHRTSRHPRPDDLHPAGIGRHLAFVESIDRWRGEMVPPRGHALLIVERAAHAVISCRAIIIVREIILARPHHFHRRVYCTRDQRRFHRKIDVQAASEAAAQQGDVDGDGRLGQPQRHLERSLHAGRILDRSPDFAAAVAHQRRAVGRFHGRVRQEWQLVDCFNFVRGALECRGSIAVIAHDLSRTRNRLLESGAHPGRAFRSCRAFVPVDFESTPPLHRRPC